MGDRAGMNAGKEALGDITGAARDSGNHSFPDGKI